MVILQTGSKGTKVKQLQQKLNELGYNCGNADGIFGKKTDAAVRNYQKANGLTVDGKVGNMTWSRLFPEPSPEPTPEPHELRTAVDADWWTSDIQKIFAKGVKAKITDVRTGLTWNEIRKAGKNHADVQPCTAADTAKMKRACGGGWSWKRRPIWVTIKGVNYAASMNCQPHGGSSIHGNKFPGHHCIHFRNSRTHATDRVDENHQKCVDEALRAKLP